MSEPKTPEGKARVMAAENPDYLTPKQQRFVACYIANGGNGTQAAIEAGYAPRSAAVTASEMLKMEKVRKKLEAEKTEQLDRLALDGDWIIHKLMEAVKQTTAKDANHIRALELLGKVEGIFAPDKKEITANVNTGDFLATLDLAEDETDPETLQ
jgi:hypothetical protein